MEVLRGQAAGTLVSVQPVDCAASRQCEGRCADGVTREGRQHLAGWQIWPSLRIRRCDLGEPGRSSHARDHYRLAAVCEPCAASRPCRQVVTGETETAQGVTAYHHA